MLGILSYSCRLVINQFPIDSRAEMVVCERQCPRKVEALFSYLTNLRLQCPHDLVPFAAMSSVGGRRHRMRAPEHRLPQSAQ